MEVEFNNREIGVNAKRLQYRIKEEIKCKAVFENFVNNFYSNLRRITFSMVKRPDHFVKELVLSTYVEESRKEAVKERMEG